ncbi:MAG: response regulator [Candidatus Omnitrophota bacterium]
MEEKSKDSPEIKKDPASGSAPDPTVEKKDAGAGKKVLIVEDEQSSIEISKNILENAGFQTIIGKNGQEGLALAAKENPHVIIADILMPDMDGFALYKELKKNEGTKNIPILILTVRKNMKESFLALGANAFLAKPVNPQEFLEEVVKLSLQAPKKAPSQETPKEQKK